MVTVNRGSELIDPLQGHSCFFPGTVEVSEVSVDHQLRSVHNHLMSIVFPSKLRDQAKSIVEESSRNQSSRAKGFQISMEKRGEVLPVVAEINKPRERRPGLERRRPRFSIKPDSSSQPAVSVEPTLDFKNFKDPEEFFRAYERHENAKREIQRVTGVLTHSELHNKALPVRTRRPVILKPNKMRAVKYKHLYPSDDNEANDSVQSSQEQFDSCVLSPEDQSSQQESSLGVASPGKQLAVGSVSGEEDKINEILDELLSCDGEELEGDGAMNILRERLQIKPIELPKLNLPDFPNMPKISLNPLNFRFSNLSNMMHKQGPERSSIPDVASPSLPKSPFASLPSLKKRISRSSPSNDPFLPDAIDWEPEPSRTEKVGNKITEFLLLEKDESIEGLKPHMSKLPSALDVGTSEIRILGDDDMTVNTDNGVTDDKLDDHNANVSAQANETNVQDEIQVEDKQQGMEDLARDSGLKEHSEINEEQCEVKLDKKRKAKTQSRKASKKKRLIKSAEHNSANETNGQDEIQVEDIQQAAIIPSQPRDTTDLALDNGSAEHIEINEEQSKKALDKKRKSKNHKSDRRQSLAGAGTKWESGVRRSTRYRCRPLEFWNGERLLFGRIHQSLPTLIGLKYSSPGSTTLKVKSFVSDEYKALVDLAALH